MNRTLGLSILLAAFLVPALFAEGTRTWQRTRFDDFEKGEANGVAISSEGTLLLAPAFQPLATTPSSYLWAIAAAPDGGVYAAGGSPARVYHIASDGKVTAIFAPQELQVQALAVAPGGAVFAATSPDGKVYRIERRKGPPPADFKPAEDVDPGWTSSLFFDPKCKYIWALALDAQGRLYVATGDRGEIYRVNPDGTGALFFNSDETHIRALAFDPKGNLIAGSDPSGLIYRITPAGDGFVLYSAPRKEITALALDAAGNIYAAGVGQKITPPAVPQPGITPQPGIPTISVGVVGTAVLSMPAQPAMVPMPPLALGQALGSDVYRIPGDGAPRRIWTSNDSLVYSLAFDASGHLLAGTGNKGRLFSLADNGDFTDLLQASAAQVTGLMAAGGRVMAATSNLGKVFVLGGARPAAAEATYESDVFDAGNFSRWGRAEVRASGAFDFFVRSGNVENPGRNWSPWKRVDLARDAAADAPPARFLQWKVALRAGEPAPRVESVTINYLPQNVPPSVEEVAVQVGARFPPMIRQPMEQIPVAVGGDSGLQPAPPPPMAAAPGALRDSDSVAVRWNAHDDNDDDLVYSLYYRGDGESNWKLLQDKITDKFYSFDRDLLPDGGYVIKVVASDSPSNPAGQALTDDKESARFELDSTPPLVEGLAATLSAGKIHVTFRAADTFSPIAHAEYSMDAGDWQVLEPVGGISDSKTESYDFTAAVPRPDPAAPPPPGAAANPSEHIVVVRVYDRYDNVGSGKMLVRGK